MSANKPISSPQLQEDYLTYIQVVRITVPSTYPWEAKRFQQFIASLFFLPGPIALKITSYQNRLSWSIEVPEPDVKAVEKAIYGVCPGAKIVVNNKKEAEAGILLYQLHGAAPFVAPLQTAELLKESDPLIPLLTIMNDLEEGEVMQFSLTLNHARKAYYEMGEKLIKQSVMQWYHFLTPSGAAVATTLKATGTDKQDKYVPELQKLFQHKLNSTLMEANLALKIRANSSQRARELVWQTVPALAVFERVGCNFLMQPQEKTHALVLTAEEVAALWHFPTKDLQISGIQWAGSSSAPIPTALSKKHDGIEIGTNQFQGKTQVVQLPYRDRITHVNIIGRTGVGKSTLMHHMIHQDIANGKGVGVIDPHGQLVQQLLECSIAEGREEDVVLFDLTDTEFPIGLNLLVNQEGVSPEETASYALEVIRKMFADNWHTGRMETALYSALITLMNVKGMAPTLMDIERIFHDSDFRAELLTEDTDPVALTFWLNQYNPVKPQYRSSIADPITNRLNAFYRNPGIRNIICQPNSLNFTDILENNRIFLARLSGVPKIEAETLGALLVSKFQIAAMSYTRLQSQPEPYYLYIDEVQNFVTTSLPEMLSGARQFGLSLVIANQFLRQLEGDVLAAVMGNTGTNILFRIGSEDAPKMASYVKPEFSREDLTNLNRFHAVVKMQAEGETLPAFSMQTENPRPKKANAEEQIEFIKHNSRTQYARPKGEVQKEISKRILKNSKNRKQVDNNNDEETYLG